VQCSAWSCNSLTWLSTIVVGACVRVCVYVDTCVPRGVWVVGRTTKEVVLSPVVISRNKDESVLIESSINSVRVSIKIKQKDDLEMILVHKFSLFLMQRAEQFLIMRRKPVGVSASPVVRCWCWLPALHVCHHPVAHPLCHSQDAVVGVVHSFALPPPHPPTHRSHCRTTAFPF
jgi:hypothetical protein